MRHPPGSPVASARPTCYLWRTKCAASVLDHPSRLSLPPPLRRLRDPQRVLLKLRSPPLADERVIVYVAGRSYRVTKKAALDQRISVQRCCSLSPDLIAWRSFEIESRAGQRQHTALELKSRCGLSDVELLVQLILRPLVCRAKCATHLSCYSRRRAIASSDDANGLARALAGATKGRDRLGCTLATARLAGSAAAHVCRAGATVAEQHAVLSFFDEEQGKYVVDWARHVLGRRRAGCVPRQPRRFGGTRSASSSRAASFCSCRTRESCTPCPLIWSDSEHVLLRSGLLYHTLSANSCA